MIIEAVAIAVSGVLFAYLRFTTHALRVQAHAGLVFMVLNLVGVTIAATFELLVTLLAIFELLVFMGVVAPAFSFSEIGITSFCSGE